MAILVEAYYRPKIAAAHKRVEEATARRDALFIKSIQDKNWSAIREACDFDWPAGHEVPYYHGIHEALKQGHGDVPHWLAFGQSKITEAQLYMLLYTSVMLAERTVFDFLVYYQIDLRRANVRERNKNAMNYYEEGCRVFAPKYGTMVFVGSPADREYVRQVLVSRGVTPNVLAPEHSAGLGGCCNVM
jgi:hypothetical protein